MAATEKEFLLFCVVLFSLGSIYFSLGQKKIKNNLYMCPF